MYMYITILINTLAFDLSCGRGRERQRQRVFSRLFIRGVGEGEKKMSGFEKYP